jgi:hypothetical protein
MSGGLVLMSTSTRLLLPLLMGLNELTDADKVSPLLAAYRPPFIVPKRLLLACICIENNSLLSIVCNHQNCLPVVWWTWNEENLHCKSANQKVDLSRTSVFGTVFKRLCFYRTLENLWSNTLFFCQFWLDQFDSSWKAIKTGQCLWYLDSKGSRSNYFFLFLARKF